MATTPPVLPGTAVDWELHKKLPATLTLDEILATNNVSSDLHEFRSYEYNSWEFELAPGVFRPGPTSRLVHDRLVDGTIPVAGLRYAAMGCGVGVEAVIAGHRGAHTVYAMDVHKDSVNACLEHYDRLVGAGGPPCIGVVGDLWDGFPDGVQVDVVTFNAPCVALKISEDPDIVRNLCVGESLAQRFFDQVLERDVLAPGGVIYLMLSNTSRLRDIVAMALNARFHVEVLHVQEWPDEDVQTYIFRLTRS